MRFNLSVTAASVLAVANAGVIQRDAAALKVELSAADASGAVIATVTNTGAVDMNLLTLGTFLDSAPVEKLDVINEASMKSFFLPEYVSLHFHSNVSDEMYFEVVITNPQWFVSRAIGQ
jgi:hypothetical protein